MSWERERIFQAEQTAGAKLLKWECSRCVDVFTRTPVWLENSEPRGRIVGIWECDRGPVVWFDFFFFFRMVSFMLRCWHFSFLGNFWFQDVIPWLSWGAQEVIYDFFRGLCHSPFQLHGESGLCFQIAGEAFQIVLRFCRSQKKVKRK